MNIYRCILNIFRKYPSTGLRVTNTMRSLSVRAKSRTVQVQEKYIFRRDLLKTIFSVTIASIITNGITAQSTTTTILTPDTFMQWVKGNHPYIINTNLKIEQAKAFLISARGGFDPVIQTDWERKTFDGVQYFNYWNPEIKIPIYSAIELKAGWEENTGLRISNDLTAGKSSYLGIKIPLLRDLWIDKKRTAVLDAQLNVKDQEANRLIISNNTIYKAMSAYWDWAKEYAIYKLFTQINAINEQRFKWVKNSVVQGDRPAIDTTETLAQWQSIKSMQTEAYMNWQTAATELANYIWLSNVKPDSMWWKNTIPDTNWLKPLPNIIETIDQNIIVSNQHPVLQQYQIKQQQLKIDQRYKFQQLLPVANMQWNILNKGYNSLKTFSNAAFDNNYKLGFQVAIPLRFFEGRGAYKQATLKLREWEINTIAKQWELENILRKSYIELTSLLQQVQLNESIYQQHNILLKAEEYRFRLGESSLFLVNSRENKMLETYQKLILLKTKLQKQQIALQWAAGKLL